MKQKSFDFLKNEIAHNISLALDLFVNNIIKSIDISDITQNIVKSIDISDITQNIVNAIRKIIPTEEEKKNIIESLQNWGNCGWCLIEVADMSLYGNNPKTIQEADDLAMKYCTDAYIDELALKISALVDNEKEFNEAIISYGNECYTACSLLLYATIDSIMIRLQEYKGSNTSNYRKLANKYADEMKKSLDNKMFLSYASTLATLNAITKYFLNGQDFTNEPLEISNRNFVSHGMNTRPVTKIDCIKLMLIINGLYKMIDCYNLKFKSKKYTVRGEKI